MTEHLPVKGCACWESIQWKEVFHRKCYASWSKPVHLQDILGIPLPSLPVLWHRDQTEIPPGLGEPEHWLGTEADHMR